MKRVNAVTVAVAKVAEGQGELSAEAVLRRELVEMGAWLSARGVDVGDLSRSDAEGRDRLCWRVGYFAGLKQALAMLTGHGETLH